VIERQSSAPVRVSVQESSIVSSSLPLDLQFMLVMADKMCIAYSYNKAPAAKIRFSCLCQYMHSKVCYLLAA
jgi:hypothetical protein